MSIWYTLSRKQRHHILFWALTRLSKHKQFLNAEQVVFINKDFVVSCCWFLRLKTIQNFFYCIPVYVLYANVNLWEWHAIMKIPNCSRLSSKCSGWVFMLTSYSPNVPCMLSKHVHVRDSPIAQDVNKKKHIRFFHMYTWECDCIQVFVLDNILLTCTW